MIMWRRATPTIAPVTVSMRRKQMTRRTNGSSMTPPPGSMIFDSIDDMMVYCSADDKWTLLMNELKTTMVGKEKGNTGLFGPWGRHGFAVSTGPRPSSFSRAPSQRHFNVRGNCTQNSKRNQQPQIPMKLKTKK